MPKKVLLVDSKRNICCEVVNELADFSEFLMGEINTICIKPVERSICIAAGSGIELCHPFKKLYEVLNEENFIVYIVDNSDGKGIDEAPIISMNDDEVEYFHKFKEKVLLWN